MTSMVIPAGLLPLTPHLSSFLADARSFYGVTREDVAQHGGPDPELQAVIERGDRDDVGDIHISRYDGAYGWPIGYTDAVARNFYELHRVEFNPALLGEEADALLYPGGIDRHPHSVHKTLTAWRNSSAATQYSQDATYLGFDPVDGRPVLQSGAMLTNLEFRDLRSAINARRGATIVDRRAADLVSVEADNYDVAHRVGDLGPEFGAGKRISVDPLSDLHDIGDAKRLARALMKVRPDVPTTAERAAFTFLAIAAFGGDPLVTANQLKTRQSIPDLPPPDGQIRSEFFRFWRGFVDDVSAGSALAEPDLIALDLLAGILEARDSALRVDIGAPRSDNGRRTPSYEAAPTVRASTLTEANPALVFYDSGYAPELPTCIAQFGPHRTTTIYRSASPAGGAGPFTPIIDTYTMRRSIGIANAHDLAVLSQYDREHMGTLTNFASGYAVYCDGGHVRRVWIPDL
jgi:hypothetical protein